MTMLTRSDRYFEPLSMVCPQVRVLSTYLPGQGKATDTDRYEGQKNSDNVAVPDLEPNQIRYFALPIRLFLLMPYAESTMIRYSTWYARHVIS